MNKNKSRGKYLHAFLDNLKSLSKNVSICIPLIVSSSNMLVKPLIMEKEKEEANYPSVEISGYNECCTSKSLLSSKNFDSHENRPRSREPTYLRHFWRTNAYRFPSVFSSLPKTRLKFTGQRHER